MGHSQFIYTLLGNTQAAKRARLLTRAVDPKHHALWMLPDLYTYLCEYAYQVYDQNEHSGIGMTPQAAYLWGMKQGGEREHRRIPYDDRFLKATCPTTSKGTAIVQKGSGVKVNHFYYWAQYIHRRYEGQDSYTSAIAMSKRPVSSFLTIGYNIAIMALYKAFERRQKKRFSPVRLISATHRRCAPQAA